MTGTAQWKPEGDIAPATYRLDRENRRIPELDGVRGLAVGIILLHHFASNPTMPPQGSFQGAFLLVVQGLWCGVDLFFVLSGFLITGILLRTRQNNGFLQTFYARRVLRIFPIAYLAVAVWFWAAAPLLRHFHAPETFGHAIPTGVAIPWPEQIWFFLYLENWPFVSMPVALGHFWSLAVEEQFYTFWPFVILFFHRRLEWVCFGVIVGSAALRLSMFHWGVSYDTIYHLTFCRMDELAAGALLAVVVHRSLDRRWFHRLALPAFLCFVLIVSMERSARFAAPAMAVAGPTFLASSFAGLVSVAMCTGSSVAAIMRSPALRNMGKYSYAVYVFHYPIYLILSQSLRLRFDSFWGQSIAMVAAGVTLSYFAAWISWNVVERRVLAVKDRLYPTFSGA